MNDGWCQARPAGVRLAVQVMPNAKKSEVAGLHDGMLKIRLQAQPIEGKANEALVRFLADLLAIPKSAITLAHGHTGRRKVVEVKTERSAEDVRQALLGPRAAA